jgi:hypothetical protein
LRLKGLDLLILDNMGACLTLERKFGSLFFYFLVILFYFLVIIKEERELLCPFGKSRPGVFKNNGRSCTQFYLLPNAVVRAKAL